MRRSELSVAMEDLGLAVYNWLLYQKRAVLRGELPDVPTEARLVRILRRVTTAVKAATR